MRKFIALIIFTLSAGQALALTDISIGAFGGLNIPVAQEDAKTGNAFGLKAKFSPSPMIGGSIFYENRAFGDPEITVGGLTMSIDGGKVTSFGAELLIGNVGGAAGPHFYWALGISNYQWKRDGFEDHTKVGYHLGPGFELVLPAANIGIEGRGKFEIVPTGSGGSRKNALVFVGVNYHFGLL